MQTLGSPGVGLQPRCALRGSAATPQRLGARPAGVWQQQQRRRAAPPPRQLGVQCSASAAAAAAPGGWEGDAAAAAAPAAASAGRRWFPEWLAAIRATCFYLTTFAFATPLFGVMLALYPFVLLFDRYRWGCAGGGGCRGGTLPVAQEVESSASPHPPRQPTHPPHAYRRRAEHVVNTVWAKLTTLFYYPVEIVGLDNLPPPTQPAVFVSNHLSFLVRWVGARAPRSVVGCGTAGQAAQRARAYAAGLAHAQDIYTLFHLDRDFKFISKTSNFLIPIIGWSMFLTGLCQRLPQRGVRARLALSRLMDPGWPTTPALPAQGTS